MAAFTLTFFGSGDAFGSGGRFNTCFHVAAPSRTFLIDCGATSMVAIRKHGVDPNAIGTILVTHLHGDHFGGLPFFLLDAQLVSRRTAPLTLAGPPGFKDRLLQAMENFFPGSTAAPRKYDLAIRELEPGEAQEVDGIVVTPTVVSHYCGAPPFAYRIAIDGRSICYSGDTEWVEGLIDAARGADLFVCEAYFFEKAVKWHLDYATLAKRLPEIGAKRVIVTHMSADMLGKLDRIAGCEAASDGMQVAL